MVIFAGNEAVRYQNIRYQRHFTIKKIVLISNILFSVIIITISLSGEINYIMIVFPISFCCAICVYQIVYDNESNIKWDWQDTQDRIHNRMRFICDIECNIS